MAQRCEVIAGCVGDTKPQTSRGAGGCFNTQLDAGVAR